jgi:hypothetical protein
MSSLASAGEWAVCNKKARGFVSQDLAQFQSGGELDAEAAARARLTMEEPDNPFPHGMVTVVIRRLSLGSVNAENFEVFFVDASGKKVGSRSPRFDVGSAPPAPGPLAGSAQYWWNLLTLKVPESGPGGLTMHVYDKVMKDKCVFRVGGQGTQGRSGMSVVGHEK